MITMRVAEIIFIRPWKPTRLSGSKQQGSCQFSLDIPPRHGRQCVQVARICLGHALSSRSNTRIRALPELPRHWWHLLILDDGQLQWPMDNKFNQDFQQQSRPWTVAGWLLDKWIAVAVIESKENRRKYPSLFNRQADMAARFSFDVILFSPSTPTTIAAISFASHGWSWSILYRERRFGFIEHFSEKEERKKDPFNPSTFRPIALNKVRSKSIKDNRGGAEKKATGTTTSLIDIVWFIFDNLIHYCSRVTSREVRVSNRVVVSIGIREREREEETREET